MSPNPDPTTMEFELRGWPGDGVSLELDYREFSYAGKFVVGDTGKAVLTEGDDILAAASFSPDRTDEATARIRYVTVRDDRQGDGLGPKLLARLRVALREQGYEQIAIAVNNPFAYQAAYRAGFAWRGDETGLSELVLFTPGDRDPASYRAGFRLYLERDTRSETERDFIDAHMDETPPPVVDPPSTHGRDSS